MEVDLTRFSLAIAPERIEKSKTSEELMRNAQVEYMDGAIDANGTMRLTPEVAKALTGDAPTLAGGRCSVTLQFDMFFTEAWPRDDENDVLKAWDMKFRGTGKADCDISKVEEKRDAS